MRRIRALVLAAAVLLTSIPVNTVPVYALEQDLITEENSIIPERSDVLSDSDELISSEEELTVTDDSCIAAGNMVVGGYIEMPWDNDTPVVDDGLDYNEVREMIVDGSSDDQMHVGHDQYVTDPGTIDAKFPSGTDEQILTYLKDKYPATRSQSPYGTCWAHSSVALTEFYMISHGLADSTAEVDKDVNFSELQLAYFCYNQAADPANGTTGDRVTFDSSTGGKESFLDFGGNLDFASQSLMRYNGVTADEGDAAYSNAATVLAGGLSQEYSSSKDEAHLLNEYHINIKENPRLVKQAIKENGIAGVSIYADGKYMNYNTNAYYNNYNTSTNHAVAIVGWDDNFPASNFLNNPGANGAWLIRNSWTATSTFSYYSYFWLSYKDKSLSDTAYVFEVADRKGGEYYDNNYNYDSQLHSIITAPSVKTANIFTSVKNSETLKAVQIDSSMNAPGAYTVEIYKSLTDLSDPVSGTKASSVSGTLPFAGKYTIPLNSGVELTEGESFSVVVTTEKQIDREYDYTWKEQIVMDAAINQGESYAYINNKWTDLSTISSNGTRGNICIRALTNTNGGSSLPDRITSLTVRGKTDQSVTLVWPAAKDANGYEVYYSTSEDGSYTLAGQADATDRKYKCTGLSAGTTYYFKVYPLKGGSRYDAGVSSVVSASTSTAKPEVEIVETGCYTATVRWNKLENCDGYEYRWGKGNIKYNYLETMDNEVLITNLDPGEKHQVWVRAYKIQNGTKIYSEECEIELTTKPGTGHAVSNLKAEPYSPTSVMLTWDEQEEVYAYRIEQSTNGNTFTELGTYYPDNDFYAGNLNSNTKYYFRVTAIYTKFTDSVEFTSSVVSSYPKLSAVGIKSASHLDGNIKITWTGVTGANYYSIFRKESSSSEFIPLDIVPASGQLEYTDRTAIPGRYYYYRVNGCRTNELTDKQGSAANHYGAYIPLAAVDDLNISNISTTSVTLGWGAITGAQGYVISQLNSQDQWEEIVRIDSKNTSYTLEGLTPNTSYIILVQAFTDYLKGGGTGKRFNTAAGNTADKSFFTVTDLTKTYTGSPLHPTVTCSNAEVNSAGFSILYGKKQGGTVSSYSAEEPVSIGEYRIKIRTNASANFSTTELTDDSWVFTINPPSVTPTQTVTFSGITGGKVNKTYGDGDYTLTATAAGTITYTSSDTSVATVGLSDGKVHINKTGETTITATAAPTDTQAAGSASYLLVVGKKEIGITWSNTAFTYDKKPHVPTAAATGLKSGDTCNLTVSGEQTNVGSYTATVTGLDNDNYKLPSSVTKGFMIAAAPVTVSGITAYDKVYDGTTAARLDCSNAVFTGMAAGDVLTVTATGAFSDPNVGDDKVVNISGLKLGGASVSNYTLASSGQQTRTSAKITGATAAFTAPTAKNLTYNGQAQTLINAGTSQAGTSMVYSLSRDGEYLSDLPSGTDARTYTVWYKVDGGINYSDSVPQSINVTIKKADISGADVVLGPALTYSGTVQTQTVSGVTLGGITIPVGEYTITGNTALNAGSYTLTVTAVNDKSCTGSVEKTFAVAKKSIIPLVTVTGSYVYTGNAINPEYTVTDGTDTLAPTDYAGAVSDNINAGQGKIKITAMLKGNYSFEDITQSFTIAKAPHEDVALSGSAMYGAAGTIDLTAAATAGSAFDTVEIASDVNGILDGTPSVNGKTLSYKFKDLSTDSEHTAKIRIKVSGAYNYDTYYVIATVTAGSKADAQVTITGGNRETEYGSAGFTLAGKAAAGGSGGRWTWKSSQTSVAAITNTGAVTIKGMGSTLITAKYESDTAAGEASITLTVTQKTLGITWSNISFEYDGMPHQPTASVSGVVRGDDCSVSVSGTGTDMGSYTATATLTGSDNDNYRLPADGSTCSFTIGKLSISNAKVTLGTPLTYTGSEQTQEVLKIELGGEDITPYCDITNNTAKNAGSYTLRITAKADSNYSGITVKQFSIAKKSVTPSVTVTGTNRYTGEPVNPSFTVMVDAEVLEATEYTVSVTDNIEAGEGKITITPASGGNYIFGPMTETFTIEKANHEDVTASGGAKPGMRGTVDLAPFIEEGGSLGTVSVSDPLDVLASKPSVNGTSLTFTFKNDPEKMSESALVTVPVKGSKNYLDYSVNVTLTVTNCEHEHTVIRDKKEASCIEEGYTGDVYCTDCGLMIEQGKPVPVDSTKHVYDKGVITKEPTVYTVGIRTYTCIHCGHTYTEPVARLDGEEDLSDLIDDITDDDGRSRGEVKTEEKADGTEETTFIVDNRVVEKVVTRKDGETDAETHIWVGGLKSRYTYTGSAIKPEFHVYDGTKKLGSGEYIYKYSNNTAVGSKAAISIRFKGDYKETEPLTIDYAIVPAYLGSDIVVGDIAVVQGKKEQKPVPVITMVSTGKRLNKKDFNFIYKDKAGNVIPGVTKAGTYTVEVTSENENIVGKATASIYVSADKNLLLSNAAVKFSPDSYLYEGWPIVPPAGSYQLTLNGRELDEGTDYTVGRITGNVAPGTATVEYIAVDGNEAGYVGSKTASFKIVAGRQIKWGEGFSYSYDDSVSYVKSGAKPRVTVRDMGTVLKEGTDYTVSYSKNKAVTDGKTAEIKVRGIGRYKGSVTLKYEIIRQHIGAFARNITADDKVVSKKGHKDPTVTVTDLNGTRLSAGKDYKIDPDSYVIVGPDGKTTDTASGGDTIYVDLVGIGNYDGRVGISYRYVKAPIKLSKAGAARIRDKVYTGREVRLTDDDLTNVLYIGSKKSPAYLKPGKDFVVAGYSKNIKTGTAKVTLKGIGEYSGMKSLSFKITARKGDFRGVLIDGEWR